MFFLSTPMGVDNIDVGFNMEVQPFVTHNTGWPLYYNKYKLS